MRKSYIFLLLLVSVFSCRQDQSVSPGPSEAPYEDRSDNSPLLPGNPSGATTNPEKFDNYLSIKSEYVVAYNRDRGTANWVGWHLQGSDVAGAKRQNDFRPDASLPAGWYAVKPSDYTSADGFDRGHLCPSADRTSSEGANSATFLMTNMVPQAPLLNRGLWEELESYCRELALEGNELYILAGAYGTGGDGANGKKTTLSSGKVTVPGRLWKLIVVLSEGNRDADRIANNASVIAVDIPNSQSVSGKAWEDYVITPADLEAKTKYRYFSGLGTSVSTRLKAQKYVVPKADSGADQKCGTYNGNQLYRGTKGGCYYLNKNGNKTYVDRAFCNC